MRGRLISPVPSSERLAPLAWSSILLLAAAQFAAYVDRGLPAVVAPLIKAQFGLTDTQIGLMQGPAFATLYAVGLLVAGHFVAGRNPWRLVAGCMVVWTGGGVLFALAPDYPGMLAARVAMGLGQAFFAPAALMLLAGQEDAARRARALSTFTTGSATGRSAALLLGGAALAVVAGRSVAGLEPWRAASLVLVLPNLALIAFFACSSRRHEISRREPGQGIGAAMILMRNRWRVFAPILIVGAGSVLLVQATGAWSASILNRGFSLSAADAALLAGAVVLTFAPAGHLGAGWLLGSRAGRRVGTGPLLAAGMVLAAAGGLLLAASNSLAGAAAGLAGLSIGGGFAAVLALIEIQSLTETRLRPQVGAVYLAFVSLTGVGFGPLLTGIISDHGAAGPDALAWALASVVGVAAVVVAGVALTFAGPWRRPPEA
ncbi:MAG: MFS transporter [Brevundimonas sp.]|uniref:MFS transporter n=1 Tax=Brevundimonas sp. TaxID=1871086 RepID=UPI002489C84E|nr:MFS transporter [Brevundimonas sp.]MDI1326103.1 MFS transporter [Brevundimonas sp.]